MKGKNSVVYNPKDFFPPCCDQQQLKNLKQDLEMRCNTQLRLKKASQNTNDFLIVCRYRRTKSCKFQILYIYDEISNKYDLEDCKTNLKHGTHKLENAEDKLFRAFCEQLNNYKPQIDEIIKNSTDIVMPKMNPLSIITKLSIQGLEIFSKSIRESKQLYRRCKKKFDNELKKYYSICPDQTIFSCSRSHSTSEIENLQEIETAENSPSLSSTTGISLDSFYLEQENSSYQVNNNMYQSQQIIEEKSCNYKQNQTQHQYQLNEQQQLQICQGDSEQKQKIYYSQKQQLKVTNFPQQQYQSDKYQKSYIHSDVSSVEQSIQQELFQNKLDNLQQCLEYQQDQYSEALSLDNLSNSESIELQENNEQKNWQDFINLKNDTTSQIIF